MVLFWLITKLILWLDSISFSVILTTLFSVSPNIMMSSAYSSITLLPFSSISWFTYLSLITFSRARLKKYTRHNKFPCISSDLTSNCSYNSPLQYMFELNISIILTSFSGILKFLSAIHSCCLLTLYRRLAWSLQKPWTNPYYVRSTYFSIIFGWWKYGRLLYGLSSCESTLLFSNYLYL